MLPDYDDDAPDVPPHLEPMADAVRGVGDAILLVYRECRAVGLSAEQAWGQTLEILDSYRDLTVNSSVAEAEARLAGVPLPEPGLPVPLPPAQPPAPLDDRADLRAAREW